jgi:hypothetical protein
LAQTRGRSEAAVWSDNVILRKTGIYETPVPENEIELSRHYDIGTVPGFAKDVVRLEARALELLARHGVVSDGRDLRAGSSIWRKDGTSSLIGVTLKSPPAVFDARSLIFLIEFVRCQKAHVKTLHERLRELGEHPDAIMLADLLTEIDRSINLLCGYAMKIGGLADRLFVGRAFEESKQSEYSARGREANKSRLDARVKLDAAVDAAVIAAEKDYSDSTPWFVAGQAHRRLERSSEVTALLADMNPTPQEIEAGSAKITCRIPCRRTLYKKIKELREKNKFDKSQNCLKALRTFNAGPS